MTGAFKEGDRKKGEKKPNSQVESHTGSRSVSLNFFLFMSFGKKEGEAVGQRSEDTGKAVCPSQGLPGDSRITVTATTGTGPASCMPSSSS